MLVKVTSTGHRPCSDHPHSFRLPRSQTSLPLAGA